uniref:Uncharacterized protein n=1 Tax=Romanomermis culicivorax TaxID=13658 RepID=A0A915JBS8_ROMCU
MTTNLLGRFIKRCQWHCVAVNLHLNRHNAAGVAATVYCWSKTKTAEAWKLLGAPDFGCSETLKITHTSDVRSMSFNFFTPSSGHCTPGDEIRARFSHNTESLGEFQPPSRARND